ncbi:hypothetical protein DM01DRAFT_1380882 [Hesseltinella vesiculosa]|uniref:Zinc phosphodiesterase ELAC protein 2 n=1 Tax=Hesseltinella vesiculosa TaxID=101127 RepID=A0A1X2GSV3_9FUNG|nr:hypothetical protein DM01DRAFT_1380882 [Hesseltinella vesiculosa]
MPFLTTIRLTFRRSIFQPLQRRTMASQIFFVGQSSSEGPPTILLQHDKQRYLFNCREGTQRLCVEDKLKLAKVKAVFMTRNQWACTGGLPGMILTVADAGVDHLKLCGGPNLTHFMAATRQFVFRTGITVETQEFSDTLETYDDKLLHVTSVRARPKQAGVKRSRESCSSDLSDHTSNNTKHDNPLQYYQHVLDQMFHRRSGESEAAAPSHTIEASCQPRPHPLRPNAPKQPRSMAYLSKALPRTKPDPMAISYICRLPTRRGTFLPKEAIKLGVKPGPLFGQLQRGGSVTLEDGTVVTHDQVCQPDIPGPLFMVIDCPDPSYIDELVSATAFQPYYNDENVKVIVHLTSDEVLAEPSYRQWMNNFHQNTDHIISSPGVCAQATMFRSHALSQYKLSKLDPSIFSVPFYQNTPEATLDIYRNLPTKSRPLQHLSSYRIEARPGKQSQFTPAPEPFDLARAATDEGMRSFDENEEYQQVITQARSDAEQVTLSEFPGHDVRVITLGTGSSVPSKYRNVSATLIKIPSYGSVLLDAGEGTYGQMLRHFGADSIEDELRALKFIFVSHLHADHHLGVIHLLTQRKKLRGSASLQLVAPAVFNTWLKEYNDVEHIGSTTKVDFLPCQATLPNASQPADWVQKKLAKLADTLGLVRVNSVEVDHCRWAYGLSMEHKDGWKLVYSGDTRPCQRLIDAGKDATLLIHEATLEDGMKEEAIAKRHSTTEEAVQVGQRMNARYTLLNHFSQRYAKVPTLSQAQANVCFSFDMMSVLIRQIPILPKFTAAMQLIFKDEEDEHETD